MGRGNPACRPPGASRIISGCISLLPFGLSQQLVMTFVGVEGGKKASDYPNNDSPTHMCQDRLGDCLEAEMWMSGCFQKYNK